MHSFCLFFFFLVKPLKLFPLDDCFLLIILKYVNKNILNLTKRCDLFYGLYNSQCNIIQLYYYYINQNIGLENF